MFNPRRACARVTVVVLLYMRERERKDTLHYIQELQGQLHSAMREVDDLREARERQKEMVSAVVKQRDMYRTLLAQSTPLPGDIVTPPRSKVASAATREGEESVAMVTTPAQVVDMETAQALKELKEQFATYRREKGENESITGEQMERFRQEASALRMDNVKIAAKVCECVYIVLK